MTCTAEGDNPQYISDSVYLTTWCLRMGHRCWSSSQALHSVNSVKGFEHSLSAAFLTSPVVVRSQYSTAGAASLLDLCWETGRIPGISSPEIKTAQQQCHCLLLNVYYTKKNVKQLNVEQEAVQYKSPISLITQEDLGQLSIH